MPIDVEKVDLTAVATGLRQTFRGARPVGYLRGRAAMRDAVVAQLACSEEEADRVIETMAGQGYLMFTGDEKVEDGGDAIWRIGIPQ